jgi:hypothetical protein
MISRGAGDIRYYQQRPRADSGSSSALFTSSALCARGRRWRFGVVGKYFATTYDLTARAFAAHQETVRDQ